MTEQFKRKTLALVLCFVTVFTSINTMAFTSVYASASPGAYTNKTWADIGDYGLETVTGYSLGTTGTDCDQYVKNAINQKYGMSVTCSCGGVGTLEDSFCKAYGTAVAGGTRSNPYSWGSLKPGDVIIFYASNGSRCHAAIVGSDGTLYHGGVSSSGKVVRQYTVKSWMDANISSGSGIDSASYTAYRFLADKGKGCIKKSIDPTYQSLDYLNSCSTYSLAGAQYGVYSSQTDALNDTNRLATLTTDANGNTGTTEQLPGTYYVKELKASPGYKLDKIVHSVTISAGTTSTWQVYEEPGDDPLEMFIKQNKADTGSTKNLEGALFTVKYYDVDSSVYTTTESVAGLTPNRSWTFKTVKITDETSSEYGKVVAYFNDGSIADRPNCLVKNETIEGVTYTSDDMYHDVYGTPTIPVGVFTIEETLAPPTFIKDDTVLYGKVYQNEDGDVKEVITGTNEDFSVDANFTTTTTKDDYQRVTISVEKKDSETKTSFAQGYASLAGAEYEVYYEDSDEKEDLLVGTITTDANGKGTLTTNMNKDSKTYGERLMPGHYHIKEVKASPGYLLNTEIVQVNARVKERNTAVFDYSLDHYETVRTTYFSKVDSETGDPIEGAVLTLLNEDGTDTVVPQWETTDEPYEVKGLPNGTYTLRELSAADGYYLAEDKKIVINDGETEVTYTIKDDPTVLNVTKLNTNGQEIAGAVMQIVDPDWLDLSACTTADEYAKAYDDAAVKIDGKKEFTTEETATVIKGVLNSGKTYILHEKSAPEGYVVSEDVKFTMSQYTEIDSVSMTDGKFSTSVTDSITSTHTGACVDEELVTDTITYKGLTPGKKYKAVATLVDQDGNTIYKDKETGEVYNNSDTNPAIQKVVDELTNLAKLIIKPTDNTGNVVEDGEAEEREIVPITAEVEFTPTSANGTVDVTFDVMNTKNIQGEIAVVYEKLYRVMNYADSFDVLVGTHEDLEDNEQTIRYPDLETEALGKDTETQNIVNDEEQVIIDTVQLTNLTVGQEYTVEGILMDKETGEPITEEVEDLDTGEPTEEQVIGTTTFTAEKSDQEIEVEFTVDATSLGNKDIVVYEYLKYDDKTIAVHEDIDDEAQTIYVSRVHTGAGASATTFVDIVNYYNLIPGLEYEIKGTLMNKDGTSSGITQSVKFTAETSDGQQTLKFDVTGKSGNTYVAFEEIYCDGKLVAAHKDINDTAQTATVKAVDTGDDSPLIPLALLFAVSVFGIITIIKRKRLNQN